MYVLAHQTSSWSRTYSTVLLLQNFQSLTSTTPYNIRLENIVALHNLCNEFCEFNYQQKCETSRVRHVSSRHRASSAVCTVQFNFNVKTRMWVSLSARQAAFKKRIVQAARWKLSLPINGNRFPRRSFSCSQTVGQSNFLAGPR